MYAIDLDTSTLGCTDNIYIDLIFNYNLTEYDIDVMLETESYGIYKNRMFAKLCL
jgi:hypothetical protein